MAYTVDEVSDALGVPRPTLYRYLREYSVPHLRRAGKIYVPEESFDRIREIRELHREGLDTESVRRRLQEGNGSEGLVQRLDRLSEALERDPKETGNGTTQALHTVLARQTVLISEVSNLTEMMEELLAVHGVRRVAVPDDPDTVTLEETPLVDNSKSHPENHVAASFPPGSTTSPETTPAPVTPARRGKFGSLRRRRRVLAILLALLTGVTLVYGGAFDSSPEEASEPPQEEIPAGPEEIPTEESPEASPESSDDEPTGYDEAPVVEQPAYPVQDAAPERLYQDQPVQQELVPGLPEPVQPVPQPGGVQPMPVLQ